MMEKLYKMIQDMANRGPCTCGQCIDAPDSPKEDQPNGHTVDLVFFKVAASDQAEITALKNQLKEDLPEVFDGEEHSYLELGGRLGDQGCALMLIGLGHLLGLWTALSPATMQMPKELWQQMAGMGMVSLKASSPVNQAAARGGADRL